MPRAAAANSSTRHKTGVVSRVPCGSRNAEAFETDRNTDRASVIHRDNEEPNTGAVNGERSDEQNECGI
jgi:hypothetical protein